MGFSISLDIDISLEDLEKFRVQVEKQLNSEEQGPVKDWLELATVKYRSYLQERFDTYSRGGGDWPALAKSTVDRRRGPTAPIDNAPEPKKKSVERQKTSKRRKVSLKKQLVKAGKKFAKKAGKSLAKKLFGKRRRKRKTITNSAKQSKVFTANRNSLARDTKRGGRLVRAGKLVSILRDTNTLFLTLDPVFRNQPGAFQATIPFGIQFGIGGNQRYSGGKGKGQATIADIASFHQRGSGRLPQRKIFVDAPSSLTDSISADLQRAIDKLL